MNTKEYYLSVSKDEAKAISEAVAKLYGFIVGYVNSNVDAEHGPVNEMADVLMQVRPTFEKLHKALAEDYTKIKDQNSVVKQAKQDMVDDIVSALSSNATGLDLITKLISALDNYEIIGREQFKGGGDPNDNSHIPF
jgi:hypothetical protein